jgi:hypothetical protein
MEPHWKSEFTRLLESVVHSPYGSVSFWTTLAIGIGTLLLVGWWVANFVCSVQRGVVVSFVSHVVPGAAGAAGWLAVAVLLVPEVEPGPLREGLPLAGAVAGAGLAAVVVTRSVLGLSATGAIVSVGLTYACVAGAILVGGSFVREMDSGLNNLADHRERRELDTRSVTGS